MIAACPLRAYVDPRLLRFSAGATAVMLGIVPTALALTSFLMGADLAGYGLTVVAFGTAALDASTGVCLGYRAYLLFRRSRSA